MINSTLTLHPALCLLTWFMGACLPLEAAPKEVYQNDFQSMEPGADLSEGFLVFLGDFSVKKEGDNHFLELPGAPLESFGIFFGPSKKENVEVTARIHGTNVKRRYPAFAVGIAGIAGFRLQVAPAKRALEVIQNDQRLATTRYRWEPGTWTHLRLRLVQTGEKEWTVHGKAWKEGDPEPEEWMVTHVTDQEPYEGQASVWGKPYSGTPIRYDDLKVLELTP